MRHYETRSVTVERVEEVRRTCDGCGVDQDETEFGRLVEVFISVNEGEEFGGADELDFCDPCLVARAPALRAAGSTAEIITEDSSQVVTEGDND